jgi:hypothetical protein
MLLFRIGQALELFLALLLTIHSKSPLLGYLASCLFAEQIASVTAFMALGSLTSYECGKVCVVANLKVMLPSCNQTTVSDTCQGPGACVVPPGHERLRPTLLPGWHP